MLSNLIPPRSKENSYSKLTRYGRPPRDKSIKLTLSTTSITTILSTKKHMFKTHSLRTTILNMW